MYKIGKHRLFYCSNANFQVNITAEIIKPNLETGDLIEMTYFDDKLYYMDVYFTDIGSHVFNVYENGVRKHREILLISGGNLILYPEG